MSGDMNKEQAAGIIRDALGDAKAEEFLSSILGPEEWAKKKEEAEERNEELKQAARLFYNVFATGDGPQVLEILRHKTIFLSTMDRDGAIIEGNIPLNPGEFMAGREMQNALIRFIERQIKFAQED